MYSKKEISLLIFESISKNFDDLRKQYLTSENKIGFFYLDNLLPEDLVLEINAVFPESEDMILKKSLRENKYIAVQMNNYSELLENIIYAFQDEMLVNLIGKICNITDLHPDDNLYAGGLSLMKKNQFLNPHLDNSHDKDVSKWRVLNLLFYVCPNWQVNYGGNLELWPNGLENEQVTIESKFNRLVVMATHDYSWHSVSPIISESYSRKCISNYYFSNTSLKKTDNFHVTTFRGRPNQMVINQFLKLDSFLRMKIRSFFKKGIVKNKHVYKK